MSSQTKSKSTTLSIINLTELGKLTHRNYVIALESNLNWLSEQSSLLGPEQLENFAKALLSCIPDPESSPQILSTFLKLVKGSKYATPHQAIPIILKSFIPFLIGTYAPVMNSSAQKGMSKVHDLALQLVVDLIIKTSQDENRDRIERLKRREEKQKRKDREKIIQAQFSEGILGTSEDNIDEMERFMDVHDDLDDESDEEADQSSSIQRQTSSQLLRAYTVVLLQHLSVQCPDRREYRTLCCHTVNVLLALYTGKVIDEEPITTQFSSFVNLLMVNDSPAARVLGIELSEIVAHSLCATGQDRELIIQTLQTLLTTVVRCLGDKLGLARARAAQTIAKMATDVCAIDGNHSLIPIVLTEPFIVVLLQLLHSRMLSWNLCQRLLIDGTVAVRKNAMTLIGALSRFWSTLKVEVTLPSFPEDSEMLRDDDETVLHLNRDQKQFVSAVLNLNLFEVGASELEIIALRCGDPSPLVRKQSIVTLCYLLENQITLYSSLSSNQTRALTDLSHQLQCSFSALLPLVEDIDQTVRARLVEDTSVLVFEKLLAFFADRSFQTINLMSLGCNSFLSLFRQANDAQLYHLQQLNTLGQSSKNTRSVTPSIITNIALFLSHGNVLRKDSPNPVPAFCDEGYWRLLQIFIGGTTVSLPSTADEAICVAWMTLNNNLEQSKRGEPCALNDLGLSPLSKFDLIQTSLRVLTTIATRKGLKPQKKVSFADVGQSQGSCERGSWARVISFLEQQLMVDRLGSPDLLSSFVNLYAVLKDSQSAQNEKNQFLLQCLMKSIKVLEGVIERSQKLENDLFTPTPGAHQANTPMDPDAGFLKSGKRKLSDMDEIDDAQTNLTIGSGTSLKPQKFSRQLFAPPFTLTVVSRCLFLIGEIALVHPKIPSHIPTLVQSFVAPSLFHSQSTHFISTPDTIRSFACISLGKLCIGADAFNSSTDSRSPQSKLAHQSIAIFSRELHSPIVSLRNNALTVLGQLSIVYPSITEHYIPGMCALTQDTQSSALRLNALAHIAALTKEDFVRLRGPPLIHCIAALADRNDAIRDYALQIVKSIFLQKNPKLIENDFVEMMLLFNHVRRAPHRTLIDSITRKSTNETVGENNSDGASNALPMYPLHLAGPENANRRFVVYTTLLSLLTDEQRFSVISRLVDEVLEPVCAGAVRIDSNTVSLVSAKARSEYAPDDDDWEGDDEEQWIDDQEEQRVSLPPSTLTTPLNPFCSIPSQSEDVPPVETKTTHQNMPPPSINRFSTPLRPGAPSLQSTPLSATSHTHPVIAMTPNGTRRLIASTPLRQDGHPFPNLVSPLITRTALPRRLTHLPGQDFDSFSAFEQKGRKKPRKRTLFTESTAHSMLLLDALVVMSSEEIKLGTLRGLSESASTIASINADKIDDEAKKIASVEEGLEKIDSAQKKLFKGLVKRNLAENIVPVFAQLRRLFEGEHCSLSADVTVALKEIVRDFRSDLRDVVGPEIIIAAELEDAYRLEDEKNGLPEEPVVKAKVSTPQQSVKEDVVGEIQEQADNALHTPVRTSVEVVMVQEDLNLLDDEEYVAPMAPKKKKKGRKAKK
ncbi:putative Condensin-2 complex subunit D3 [Blattamonas nauphoetae]|uniref:Condensin-2 complex subunit D3 n=1 Tax=Blattamonas nauphoetae TaxID=2049346 RepID=A0ABQ9Y4G1_9EUKA|nr:putative Condensin-2 complex subunit D3 [Blattamonas nauphoetae]